MIWRALIGLLSGSAGGACVGAAAGLLLVALSAGRSEHRYFYEGGYFDRQLFFSDLFDGATCLVGLAFVAVVVSASVTRPLAARR